MKFSDSQSCKSLEKLDHKKVMNEHTVAFNNISKSLEDFYGAYKNRKKIIQLMNAWLYLVRSLYESYGLDGVKSYSQSDFNCAVRFSFFYECDVYIGYDIGSYKSKFLFKLLNGFLHDALLPGARILSLYAKFRWRFAKFIITNIPSNVIAARQSIIVELIIVYFDNYFTDIDHHEIKKFISDALPSVFYEDQVKVSEKDILNVECAPWSLIEFSGFERVFLLDRYIHVTGLQHGGSYFAFEPSYGLRFEESISDEYIGWGLSPYKNARQHRYKFGNQKSKTSFSPKRLIWVEHCRLPIFHSLIWPPQIKQAFNLDVINYISNELRLAKANFYSMPYPNPMRSNQYDGLRGVELNSNTGRGEDALAIGDVVIFDESGSSLIHHCIEQEIPFVLVVSKDDISGFSKNKNEWFDVIRNAGLAFYDHEVGMLTKKINEIFKSNYNLPSTLSDFHRNKFIDI